jgi:hypothetical protein
MPGDSFAVHLLSRKRWKESLQRNAGYGPLFENGTGNILCRFALRILSDLNLKAASIRPVLDGFGFLDLHLKVEPA